VEESPGWNPKQLLPFWTVKKTGPQAYFLLESYVLVVSRSGNLYASPFFFNRLTAVYLDPQRRQASAVVLVSLSKTSSNVKIASWGENRGSYNLIGARWYDPELGLWLTPDPAGQFFNPYAYGGDPVNFVDPDGEFIIEAMIIGAIAGAYFGGVGANGSFNPTKWDYSETWDEIAVGAIIGGAAGGLGAYVGGPAMLAGQATGALGWGATAGLVSSSTAASLLGNLDDHTRGREKRGLSTNFGAFDVNWGAKNSFDWNNPFDDDPWYENVGDAMGWAGNFSDGLAFGDKYAWGGKDEGTAVYEPGTEGSGSINDLKSGGKHVGLSGEGHSSHLKLVYSDGTNRSISWGGGTNDFTDVSIAPHAKSLKVTGLNSGRLTAFGNKIRDYSWVKNNCGQNVCGAIMGGQTSNYFLTPSANFRLLQTRQAWRNFYGM